MRLRSSFAFIVLPALFLLSAVCVEATEYAIDPEESVFAAVVHKGGVAARFAHNHFIALEKYEAKLSLDGDDVTKTAFSISFAVNDLAPDKDGPRAKWFPRLQEADVLTEAFSPLDDSDRATIKEHMLAPNQLDGAKYPEIKAELVGIEPKSSSWGKREFGYAATMKVTIHGKTVERGFASDISLKDGVLKVEGVARFEFTEFGIPPYSAFLGTVKNKNAFEIYVNLTAKPKE
ncbi:MAG: YceI family protein [Candidatus Hydrogenedentes bacterium]|nr:YceI family protein [Candidatus Hydrogenedentota bacterium]